MKAIGSEKTYIDYFQAVCASQNGLKCYGVRVREGLCSVVVRIGNRQPESIGKHYLVPVTFDSLPIPVRMIVHRANYLSPDLMEVLAGNKTFQEALDLPAESEAVRP
jgi:hypothetical protein